MILWHSRPSYRGLDHDPGAVETVVPRLEVVAGHGAGVVGLGELGAEVEGGQVVLGLHAVDRLCHRLQVNQALKQHQRWMVVVLGEAVGGVLECEDSSNCRGVGCSRCGCGCGFDINTTRVVSFMLNPRCGAHMYPPSVGAMGTSL